MHYNPTEPNQHVVVAASVQLLCTCIVAADQHVHAILLQLPCMMHHTQNEPIKHVMAASCYCFLWTNIVAADQDVHAAAMCDAPEPK